MRRNRNKKTTKKSERSGRGQMLGGRVPGMMERVPGMSTPDVGKTVPGIRTPDMGKKAPGIRTQDVGKTVPGLGGRIHGMDKTTR